MRSKIILILVIFSLIIGCIDTSNIPSIPKSQPCTQQTSSDGKMTITQEDCKGKSLLSSEEQKLVGTWKFTGTNEIYLKFTFKDDRNYIREQNGFGKMYGTYSVSGNQIILVKTDGFDAGKPESVTYRLVDNNNLVLTFGLPFNLERTWW